MGAVTVAKKPELKLAAVKIDATLVRKAKTIAEDRGVPLSTYLSSLVDAGIVRDWPKVLKKIVDEREGGSK